MNVLIVDDEVLSVQALMASIPWAEYGISQVFSAYSCEHAKEIIKNYEVHILITDIVMHDQSGINLLAWIRENRYPIESIFVTSHAEFDYAKQAITLGVFEFHVKPIDMDEFAITLSKVIQKIKKSHEFNSSHSFDNSSSQSIDTKSFLRDLLLRTSPISTKEVANIVAEKNITLNPDTFYTLILLYHRSNYLSSENMDIAEKIAEEVFVKASHTNGILQLNHHIVCLYAEDDRNQLRSLCETFIALCRDKLQCQICCLLGQSVYIESITRCYRSMCEILEKWMLDFPDILDCNNFSDTKGLSPFIAEDLGQLLVNQYHSVVKKVTAYIRENLEKNLSRHELAKITNLNADYLARVFRKDTGLTIKEFVIREKMEKAISLIMSEDISIKEVVSQLGYDNHSYFTATFKKYTGITPRACQRRYAGKIS